MTRTEERLTDALDAVGRAVKDHDLRPLPDHAAGGSRQRTGWQRWLAPVSAAAAVVVIASFAVFAAFGHSPRPPAIAPGRIVIPVGGYPTGIAVDSSNNTAYVSSGTDGTLSLINVLTCNASAVDRAGCGHAHAAPTGGSDPIGVAVDEQTHTVCAANGSSDTVAVINAANCNAADTSGCQSRPVLVRVGAEPEFLAVDPQRQTPFTSG